MSVQAIDDTEIDKPLVIRVNNGKHMPAYIRLFDPEWEKQGCTIDIPAMQDPTIGRLSSYHTILHNLFQQRIAIDAISIWCPNIPMNLDLFTLHVYDCDLEDDSHFDNLRIFYPALDKFQMQGNVIDYPCKFILRPLTRMSFLVPAMSNVMFYFWPDKKTNKLLWNLKSIISWWRNRKMQRI